MYDCLRGGGGEEYDKQEGYSVKQESVGDSFINYP